MLSRCTNPKDRNWSYYGGRGITVCPRWTAFANFLADMGRRPSIGHSLDRYPNKDGNYEPGNVRWATRGEQSLNTRRALSPEVVREIRRRRALGEKLVALATAYGVNHSTVSRIARGVWRSLVVVALLAAARPAAAEAGTPEPTLRLVAIYGGAAAMDLASTEYALARGGVHEGNPLMRSRGVRLGVNAGATALCVWTTRRLQERGRPGLARLLKVGVVVLRVGVAVHNVHAARAR